MRITVYGLDKDRTNRDILIGDRKIWQENHTGHTSCDKTDKIQLSQLPDIICGTWMRTYPEAEENR